MRKIKRLRDTLSHLKVFPLQSHRFIVIGNDIVKALVNSWIIVVCSSLLRNIWCEMFVLIP